LPRPSTCLHSDLVPEVGYDGELIRIDKPYTKYLTVVGCSLCETDFLYEPDSTCVRGADVLKLHDTTAHAPHDQRWTGNGERESENFSETCGFGDARLALSTR